MTTTVGTRSEAPGEGSVVSGLPPGEDRPRGRSVDRAALVEVGTAALSAAAGVGLVFHLASLSAPFGMVICWFLVFVAILGVVTWRRRGILAMKDRLALVSFLGFAAFPAAVLIAVLVKVFTEGAQAIFTDFPHFLVTNFTEATPNAPFTKAGVYHSIIGTVEQVGIATAMTTPIAITTAVFINEFPSRYASIIRVVINAMSGVPSIIAALFVYLFWVKPQGFNGYSGFAGSMAISILMIPTVTRTSDEVLQIVSGSLREAALALGAPIWRMILGVVVPTARAGLVTAVILGVARDVGETAPVLFTVFGSERTHYNPFSGPQSDLPLQIYQLILSPDRSYNIEAWGAAGVLMALVLTLFTLSRLLGGGGGSRRRRGRLLRSRRPGN
jgi:phosphate transport system permease protein